MSTDLSLFLSDPLLAVKFYSDLVPCLLILFSRLSSLSVRFWFDMY